MAQKYVLKMCPVQVPPKNALRKRPEKKVPPKKVPPESALVEVPHQNFPQGAQHKQFQIKTQCVVNFMI